MNCLKSLRLLSVRALFCAALCIASRPAELAPRNFAVELTATLTANPPEITLHWVGDQYARSYRIFRKRLQEGTWTPIGTANGPDTSFVDRQVLPGQGYEYKVVKEGSLNYTGYGYIYAGMDMPLREYRGRVILVVEKRASDALGPELTRFEYDLIGDGWTVARITVNADDEPPAVKARIKALYEMQPFETLSLILFGAVPVPYSGNITPDEHDNHRGAWPADVYYAELNGAWTDDSVTSTSAERSRNHNVPGDGKFDQDSPPSLLELQVGRVDLSKMTCFLNKTPSRGEIDLLRGYLDKNHRFRHTRFKPQQQVLLFDRLGLREPEAMSAMAWRNFTPIVGRNFKEIRDSQYFPTASESSFLWSAVCAGGGYNHSDWVGTSDAFALQPVNVVFATFVGSYYGDWDNESNFLRAALGAPGGLLASMYSGKPQWLFHPMALGETIGYSAKITQENALTGSYLPVHPGNGQVHIALMGDPTLRAHPVDPVSDLRGRAEGGSYLLEWGASPAPRLQAYRVYRAPSAAGPFRRVAQVASTVTSFAAPDYQPGEVFMVRAVALTESPSGTYLNASQGHYSPNPLTQLAGEPPSAPIGLAVAKVAPGAITLAWLSTAANEAAFVIERKRSGESAFQEIARVPADSEGYTDRNFPGEGSYVYRVAAINSAAMSAYSNEAAASTLAASAEFGGVDRSTAGAWMFKYGAEGHVIPGLEQRLPQHVSLSVSNAFLYRDTLTDDPRGPELSNESLRSGNCWVANTPFAFDLRITDDRPHQLALYTASWSRRAPETRVQIYDLGSGQLLDDRAFSGIDEGAYLVYVVRRQVHIKIIPPSFEVQSEIYGLFLDPIVMQPVRIDPAGGDFNGRVNITMQTATPGAEIRYTMDGSAPTEASPKYAEGLWLAANGRIRARAFKDGAAGPVSEAAFTNKVVNNVEFLRWDDQTRGNWAGLIGGSGYAVPTASQSLPPSFQIALSGASEWIWNEVTDDPRAPFVDPSASRRRAAAWFTGTSMNFDLSVMDSRAHTVALYFLDWDRLGREQTVELIDANGRPLQSHVLRNFQNGQYFVIRLQGAARVRVSRKTGGNAVLSGIFADAAPGPIGPSAPLTVSGPRLDSGFYFFTVYGTPGSRYCLDRSSDLKAWFCSETNSLQGSAHMLFPRLGTERGKFFRTHRVP